MSYEFNMVDMGGIDIATVNGTVVDGLYNKLLEGKDACGNLILYNWKFAEIEIVPSACSILIEDEAIIVNGTIRVDNSDVISLIWADPPPVPVEPITITENGVYTAQEPLSGYNPVSVNVPIPHPRLIPITILENGEYTPPPGVDGYNPVSVNVPIPHPRLIPITILKNGEYTPPAGVDGFNSVTVAVPVADKEYIFNCGLVEGYTPVNIFNGSQSSHVSYNRDGTAHILGAYGNRRFLGFALDLTGISSVEFLCSFRNSNDTIGVIASQTIEDIINNQGGAITIYSAYTAFPPTNRVCKMTLDASALSGQYYVGILGYEEDWSSDLAQMWINRA